MFVLCRYALNDGTWEEATQPMTTRVVAFNVLCSGIGRSCQLTMFNAFLMVMLVLSSVSQAQQLPDSAAVIQGKLLLSRDFLI